MCDLNPADEKLEQLSEEIRQSGLIGNRYHRFRKHNQVLVGNELVSWLVEKGHAKDREEAKQIGQRFLATSMLHHVYDERQFEDAKLFYRFYADEKTSASDGPSAIAVSQCCTKKGVLSKKGRKNWYDRFFVLKGEEGLLYYYDSETSRAPRQVIDLKKEKVHVAECVDCKTGSYCFNISTPERVHTQCAPNSKEQEEWIQALLDVGAVFVEESYEQITQNTIFDFTVKDLDLNPISLQGFQNKVCLIVNVASQ